MRTLQTTQCYHELTLVMPDRLHFIADMFRCYELSESLFDPPFTTGQTAAIKAGILPAGRL